MNKQKLTIPKQLNCFGIKNQKVNKNITSIKRYVTIAILLLVTEIAIAKFYFTEFIRHVVGDILVIPLLYCLLKLVTQISKMKGVILVVLFAFGVECLQWISITEKLGITQPTLRTIIGTTFDYRDLIAYTVGGLLIVLIDKKQ